MKNLTTLIIFTIIALATGQTLTSLTYLPAPDSNGIPQFYDVESTPAQTIPMIKCTDYLLNAGNTFMNFGTVRVCNRLAQIYIGVYATDGYLATDAVKIWIGTNLTLLNTVKGKKQTTLPIITQTNVERPQAGQFPFKRTFTTRTYYTSFKILMEDIRVMRDPLYDPVPTCSSLYYIFVHVDCLGQTCWSGDLTNCVTSQDANGPWFCFTKYTALCPTVVPPLDCSSEPDDPRCPKYKCDTAFAYGSHILLNTFNPSTYPNTQLIVASPLEKGKRWGWAVQTQIAKNQGTDTLQKFTYKIYAGAGKNDITKGYEVGIVKYTYNTETGEALADVDIDPSKEIYVTGYHIHIGDELPSSVSAPGRYEGCHQTKKPDDFTLGLDILCPRIVRDLLDPKGIWFITHLGVCTKIQSNTNLR